MNDTTSSELRKLQKKLLDSAGTNGMTLRDGKKIYLPQTPADFEQISFWCAEGFKTSEIFRKLEDLSWRSRTEVFRGHCFCEECRQKISSEQCDECGQPLPRLLPTPLDLVPAPSEPRFALFDVAEKLFKTQLPPKTVLVFLHSYNQQICRNVLQFEDVDSIFGEAVAIEIVRRKGVAV